MEGGGAAADLVGIADHGAEFADAEGPALIAATLRPVDHRQPILQGDGQSDDEVQGPQHQQGAACDDDIDEPLEDAVIDAGVGRFFLTNRGRFHGRWSSFFCLFGQCVYKCTIL